MLPPDARALRRRQPRRRRLTPRSRHSIFVGVLKILLPAIALGLVLLLVVWSQLNLDENRFRIGLADLAPDEVDSVNVVNARYEGIDKENRPFTVTAAHATQVDKAADILDLKEPKADLTTQNGAWVAISADTGRYARGADMLDLNGSVALYHDRGFEFHTQSVKVNLKDSSAVGHDPVEGQGPSGRLTAQGLSISHGGDRILFTGRSKLILFSSSPPGSATSPAAATGSMEASPAAGSPAVTSPGKAAE
jgi:lipopolysaccharide export system protein LptC